MECHEVESLLIDYLDGQLHPGDKKTMEEHLQQCSECRKALEEYKTLFVSIIDNKSEEPGAALREKFDIMLQSEMNIAETKRMLTTEDEGKVIQMKRRSVLLKIAASIILVVFGVLAGTQLKQTKVSNNTSQLADLQSEVNKMKETLLFSMLAQESASERIKAVSYVDEIKQPDNKVIDALIKTMNEDKNVNVRLAALEAVAKYSDNSRVSDSLITSLKTQTEPIMQIALINVLTEKKETKAIGPIKDLLMNKNTMEPVKEIAQKGLNLL